MRSPNRHDELNAGESPYPAGKLPHDHLGSLLSRYAPTDPAVIVGPGVGEDSAVVRVTSGHYLVAKSDPITFATDQIGWYAVHVNANDIACSGARPRWWLATILLPEGRATAAMVDQIFAQMDKACEQVGAQLVGGHTEITIGLDRPLVVGAMLGEVPESSLITTAGAQPGDALVLTKGIAIEGTAIIAREKADALSGRLDEDVVGRCRRLLIDPGISVVADAQTVMAACPGAVHAMHDPTEGGLATGLEELAAASGCGLEVWGDAIPVYPETRDVCQVLGVDPLGLIASGSLLLAVSPTAVGEVCAALGRSGIAGSEIGSVLEPSKGITLIDASGSRPLPKFGRDELARLFEGMA